MLLYFYNYPVFYLSDDYEYLVCYIWFVKRVTTPCYCSWAITITTGTVVQSDSDVSF